MLKAAAEAANSSASKPLILAVTVLTSLTDEDLTEIGFSGSVAHEALRLAGLARMAGCGGVVSSAHEAVSLRRELGTGFAIVTPGIRPMGADVGDQARIVTPADAMRAGVSHIVVGRPITGAPKPAEAAQAILEEIASALIVAPLLPQISTAVIPSESAMPDVEGSLQIRDLACSFQRSAN